MVTHPALFGLLCITEPPSASIHRQACFPLLLSQTTSNRVMAGRIYWWICLKKKAFPLEKEIQTPTLHCLDFIKMISCDFLFFLIFLVELQKPSNPALLLLDVSSNGSNTCSLKETIIYRVWGIMPLIPAFRRQSSRPVWFQSEFPDSHGCAERLPWRREKTVIVWITRWCCHLGVQPRFSLEHVGIWLWFCKM